jgi:uncharacterized protein (TIGR02284 family)
MADGNALVKTVVEVLHDSVRGFADLSEHLTDPTAKSFFKQEGATRAEFANAIEAVAGIEKPVGGTAAGALHRTWANVKAELGGSEHTLLETAEQGEDAAKKAYKEALESSEIPADVRAVLLQQQPHIQAAHDKVKALRDATK